MESQEQNKIEIAKLRRRRRRLLIWPSFVMSFPLGCVFVMMYSEMSLLLKEGVPLTRWWEFIEIENQLFTFVVLLIFLLVLFQRTSGFVLFFFFLLFTEIDAIHLLYQMYFVFPTSPFDNRSLGLLANIRWFFVAILFVLMFHLWQTLMIVDKIDKEILSYQQNNQEPMLTPSP